MNWSNQSGKPWRQCMSSNSISIRHDWLQNNRLNTLENVIVYGPKLLPPPLPLSAGWRNTSENVDFSSERRTRRSKRRWSLNVGRPTPKPARTPTPCFRRIKNLPLSHKRVETRAKTRDIQCLDHRENSRAWWSISSTVEFFVAFWFLVITSSSTKILQRTIQPSIDVDRWNSMKIMRYNVVYFLWNLYIEKEHTCLFM